MTITEFRQIFYLTDFNTTISKGDFELYFYRTKDTVDFTFDGWDGKSYNGESRRARVWMCNCESFKTGRFVKVGKGFHLLLDDELVEEKATGKKHQTTYWVFNVARA